MADVADEAVAAMLEKLAGHVGSPVRLSELSEAAGGADPEVAAAVPVVLALLRVFGGLSVTPDPAGGEPKVACLSPQAGYFLRSLAAYIRAGYSIMDNWERPGTSDGPYDGRQVLSGPQFLHLIEERRRALDPAAVPLRRVEIVQVVVKGRLRGRGGAAQYLMQYDEQARQYQLPGGHVRASDASGPAAAVRELEEELPGYAYSPGRDVLLELGSVEIEQLSRTAGVLTGYHITIYQLRSEAAAVPSGPAGLWVPEKVLLDGQATVGDVSLNVAALLQLAMSLPGGVEGLPLSLSGAQQRPLRALVRERRWELIGLAVGVVGILVSLIPLLG